MRPGVQLLSKLRELRKQPQPLQLQELLPLAGLLRVPRGAAASSSRLQVHLKRDLHKCGEEGDLAEVSVF